MKPTEDLIWDYLDGLATADEGRQVETQLAEDTAFRELFLESQRLHSELQRLEPAVPSMRFAQNVLDKLPPVRQLAVEPLVSKRWLRVFNFGIFGLIALILGGTAGPLTQSHAAFEPANRILDLFFGLFEHIPPGVLLMGGIVTLALLALLLLDRWLQTRFHR